MATQANCIYFDFQRNAERLERQLKNLQKRHARKLFPNLKPDANILVYFVQTILEINIQREYYLSNTSLKADRVELTLRPKILRRLRGELPKGITLAIRGRLYPPGSDSPEWIVTQITDMSDSPRRDFELEIAITPKFSDEKRIDNSLTPALLETLPEISRKTRENLAHWLDYLQWKRAILENELNGICYLDVAITGEQWVFTAVFPDEAAYDELEKRLQKSEWLAVPRPISTDHWTFQLSRDARFLSSFSLGKLQEIRGASAADHRRALKNCPWQQPFLKKLCFELPESQRELIEKAPQSTRGQMQREWLRQIAANGFLTVSLIGDFTVLQRQQQALETLELQSGYAPFLSAWLFEIENAHTPQIATPVSDWLMPEINDGQMRAVKKMLNAPDVALVQGPPGTGKTTVIGEAIYQFVRQGKRVLLASQANLAVDNALDKLAAIPDIRAIRLGRSHKLSPAGKRFAEDQVLKHFYATLAEACKARFLQPWQSMRKDTTSLKKQLADLELAEKALRSLASEKSALEAREKTLRAALSGESQTFSGNQQRGAYLSLKNDLTRLIDFLNGSTAPDIAIPETLVKLIHSTLTAPLLKLKKYKIDLAEKFPGNGPSETAERQAALFQEIYRNWLKLKPAVPALRSAIGQLKNAAAVPGSAYADAAFFDKMLNIFNALEKGIPFSENLKNSRLNPQKRVKFLQISLAALEKTDAQIEKARVALCKNLAIMISRLETALSASQHAVAQSAALDKLQQNMVELETALRRQERDLQKQIDQLNALELTPFHATADNLAAIKQALQQALREPSVDDPVEQAFQKKWAAFLNKWHQWLTDPAQIRNDNQHYIDTYIEQCNVVAITCNENPRLLTQKNKSWFDVAIIDEVSKATPPELLTPMLLAKKTVLVGDHRQLPPLFKEREGSWEEIVIEAEKNNMLTPGLRKLLTRENFFKFRDMVTASLFKLYFEKAPTAIKETLLLQYRMHPDIMAVVNHFYENRLQCGLEKPNLQRDHGLNLSREDGRALITPNMHAVWVDTSRDAQHRPHYERQSGVSKVNEFEADLIIKLLRKINDAYLASRGVQQRKAVGVISFYGRQVAEIRRRLQARQFDALDIEVNTVDQFQGKEKPIVLVSLVRHTRAGLQNNTAFVTQFERINVAFSRARELLVIFGATEMFAGCEVELPHLDHPGSVKKKVYGEIIELLKRKSCVIRAV